MRVACELAKALHVIQHFGGPGGVCPNLPDRACHRTIERAPGRRGVGALRGYESVGEIVPPARLSRISAESVVASAGGCGAKGIDGCQTNVSVGILQRGPGELEPSLPPAGEERLPDERCGIAGQYRRARVCR